MIQNTPAKTYDYYHKNTFWNDHRLIREYLNDLATGNKKLNWINYVHKNYLYKNKNLKMISVACGNGWFDRVVDKLFNFKIIDGFDISKELTKQAAKIAPSSKFKYHCLNLNKKSLNLSGYDLAINLAGLHHIENMDHLVKEVYKSLKKGGLFIHFDYIGPKRNQYSDCDLFYMNKMQKRFPKKLVGRNKISRPSVEVMLKEDPSEAIGSEKIIPSLKKYFKIEHLKYLNGGMLYQVLYNQVQNFDQKNLIHNTILKMNIDYEKKMTKKNIVKPLFAFIICIKE